MKEHKPNFFTIPKCRFINPNKSNLGKISKHIPDNINISICQLTGLQQWRNTTAVISWFNNFLSKEKCKFLSFDVIDFYSSISEQLLTDAIRLARQFKEISDDEVRIILYCRKSLFFQQGWCLDEKNGSLLDVAMVFFDGADIGELVGLFLANTMTQLVGSNNIGFYRNDGLVILKTATVQAQSAFKNGS